MITDYITIIIVVELIWNVDIFMNVKKKKTKLLNQILIRTTTWQHYNDFINFMIMMICFFRILDIFFLCNRTYII